MEKKEVISQQNNTEKTQRSAHSLVVSLGESGGAELDLLSLLLLPLFRLLSCHLLFEQRLVLLSLLNVIFICQKGRFVPQKRAAPKR